MVTVWQALYKLCTLLLAMCEVVTSCMKKIRSLDRYLNCRDKTALSNIWWPDLLYLVQPNSSDNFKWVYRCCFRVILYKTLKCIFWALQIFLPPFLLGSYFQVMKIPKICQCTVLWNKYWSIHRILFCSSHILQDVLSSI